MKRTVVPELLDTDSGTPDEIADSLADLRRINRWFGGASTFCDLIERATARTGQRHISVLDVGAGSGDIAEAARVHLAKKGIVLSAALLDLSATHFRDGSAPKVAGNALALPFRDESFDVVACSTFAHHLAPEQMVQFANEALRVARVAFMVNDLERRRLYLALVYAGFPLFRSRITRHDGPASVRRAYTAAELESLLHRSSAKRVETSRHYLFRLGAIAWKA
ncbi:MAG TPA: methyltransferase domain-containing protein [Terriglobales bacterium]|nr:methyltransferase domain-containing protein [Terriglobales bacterium]